MEQTVDVPVSQAIPQGCISERIAGQIVDGPGRGTSSSSAAALGAAECPNEGFFFALFPERKKVRHLGASRVRTWRRTRAHPRRKPMTLLKTTDGSKSSCGAITGRIGGKSSTALQMDEVGADDTRVMEEEIILRRRNAGIELVRRPHVHVHFTILEVSA